MDKYQAAVAAGKPWRYGKVPVPAGQDKKIARLAQRARNAGARLTAARRQILLAAGLHDNPAGAGALVAMITTAAANCELAGLTEIGVEADDPAWGYQFITAVTREHRGHRLGLLVKVAMLELLADREPQLTQISTGNADANQHMIAINAQLGFQVVDEWPHWELDVQQALTAGRHAVSVTS